MVVGLVGVVQLEVEEDARRRLAPERAGVPRAAVQLDERVRRNTENLDGGRVGRRLAGCGLASSRLGGISLSDVRRRQSGALSSTRASTPHQPGAGLRAFVEKKKWWWYHGIGVDIGRSLRPSNAFV